MTTSSDRARAGVRAWAGLLRVHAALVPLLDRELQQATGLPLAWYDVLLELDAAPAGRLRMGDLGDQVVLSRTRVSRLVDEMVRAGLVRKDSNPEDGRSSFAVVTPRGRELFREAAPTYLAGIDHHFSRHLSREHVRVMVDGLSRVLDGSERPD